MLASQKAINFVNNQWIKNERLVGLIEGFLYNQGLLDEGFIEEFKYITDHEDIHYIKVYTEAGDFEIQCELDEKTGGFISVVA